MEPTGVLLFNMGGPDTLDDVEPFLRAVFSDRAIIELPFGRALQPAFAHLIARVRRASVRHNYEQIGGGSPQLAITRAQADALETRLNQRAEQPYVRALVAMRYTRPSIQDALREFEASGIRRIVTVSLYPHWCRATTGSWLAEFERVLAAHDGPGFEITHVDRYADHPLYLDAMADTVRRALERFSPRLRQRVTILFSAHGLPQKFVDAGDPYVHEIEATRRGVLERLRAPNPQFLGYQSRTGPVHWIGPYTDELIEALGDAGVRQLLVVPLSFVSDHIETLYEVDLLFRHVAVRAGIEEYRRPEALNLHPVFIEALAQMVEEKVLSPSFVS
jgi:ferrochelatase